MSITIVLEGLEVCDMKKRIITALLIIACVVPPLVFGGWLVYLLVAFIVVVGGLELLQLSEHKTQWPFFVKPLAILSVFALCFLDVRIQIPALSAISLLFLSIPICSDHFHAKDAFLCIVYIVVFYTIASGFMDIYNTNAIYVWYIIIATYVCDTGAYFCGRFLGKHKLNVRISPKKTWEGAIGGWFFAMILSFLFGYFFIDTMTPLQLLCASIILPITGQIGDLSFSAIKRCFQIKDFSDLLPGHGGVLDRVDSLVFNFVFFHLILMVVML